jgi:hypothetical protein
MSASYSWGSPVPACAKAKRLDGGNHATSTCFMLGNPSTPVAPQDRAGSPLA